MIFSVATTGLQDMRLPQWGRAFWQDPNDDELFLAYASGTSEVNFITSTDDGFSWSAPALLFPVEDFDIHNNFDTVMDRDGHIHCGFRFAGSGCYQFVGKLSGGGWTLSSGVGPVGLVAAGDSGVLNKGFQGSLTIQETAGATETVAFPAVKIAAKDDNDNIAAFVLGTPYSTGPLIDPVSGSPNAGPSGGFPVIYVAAGESHIVYFDEPNNALDRLEKSFGTYFAFQTKSLSPGEVPFGPSMCIGSGIGLSENNGMVFVCSSGVQADGIGLVGQTVYSHVDNTALFNTYHNIFDISGGTENSWVAKAGFIDGGPPSGNFIESSGVVPTGNIYGVGPNIFSPSGVTIHQFPGEGTNCDFSFNDAGETLFYFQRKNEWGRQSIGRFKSTFGGETWTFPLMDHPESGLKYTAAVSQTTTGGFSNVLFWGGFKALKHPVEPSASGTKKEMLVTQGHVATYPSGGILTIWDVAESPALGTWPVSEFSLDYTVTSGTPREVFVGINEIANFQFQSHIDRLPFLFDDTEGAAGDHGLIRDGYLIGLELDKIRTIDRFEILHRNLVSTPAPGVALSGSMDSVNWTRVLHIPSGIISGAGFNDGNSLIKFQARGQTVTELANAQPTSPPFPPIAGAEQPIHNLDPFTAKFIRLQFENTHKGSHRVYEIKLFGPGATNPEIVTWSDDTNDPPPYNRLFITAGTSTRGESFGRQQGTLPPDWRTSGDFEWAVVASGDFTKPVGFKPTDPLPFDFDGKVPSGIWSITNVGNFRGVGDGFSLRSEAIGDASGLGNPLRSVPSGGIQPGMVAIVEVDINVLASERTSGGSVGRDVGFNIRSDVHVDDKIEFFIDDVLQETYSDIGWNTFTSYTVGEDIFEEPERFTASLAGTKTLKWIYTKGAYDPVVSFNVYPFGAAWIDNIFGLDVGPLEGAPRDHRYGFLVGVNPFESSEIDGFIEGFEFASETINAFTSGSPSADDSRKGFLQSRFGIGDQVIHGFASSGVGFQSSVINVYVLGATSGIDSSIHGIVGNVGDDNIGISQIHGFLQSRFGIGDQVIHGFVGVQSGSFDNSIINGYMIGWDGGISGLGPNQSAILGFLSVPLDSGISSIHGYLMGNFPIESIHGYMGCEGLVASGGGCVGDSSTSNVVPGVNFIHGYLKGLQGGQIIHGYVKRPSGVFSSIHGYVLAGAADGAIHGYAKSFEMAATGIHGYASGIGFESSSINGYMFGVSGIINSSIHGYMAGIELPNSEILGVLIGTVFASGSAAACPSHNFPLCPLPSFTLPTGFIN